MPSLTEEDSASLKSILLDSMDELKSSGLNEEEAFAIASMRLGIDSQFEEECEMINSDTLLIRKILLVFTGMIIFFLLHYSMLVCERSIFYFSHDLIPDPQQLYLYTLNFIICYYISFLLATTAVFKWNKEFFKKIDDFNIKPLHILFLMCFVFGLAFIDYQLQYLIRAEISIKYLTNARFYAMINYSDYSFSFVAAVCFLILLKKIKLFSTGPHSIKGVKTQFDFDEFIKTSYSQPFLKLTDEGWDEEEAIGLIKIRHKILPPFDNKQVDIPANDAKSVKFPLIALSGPLVYLFLFYLLHSTIGILLTVLQHIENDPMKNFGWIKWYIASFNLILVFFTTSLYIEDTDLLQKLKKINRRKFYTLFFTTILLCIINCFFLAISKRSLGNIFELKEKFNDMIIFSDLIFPMVISLCFFILFAKYYRGNNKRLFKFYFF